MKAFKILFLVLFMLMMGATFGQSHEDTNNLNINLNSLEPPLI